MESYYMYTNVYDGCYEEYLDEDGDSLDEGDYDTKVEVSLNENHFFRGYFFFNDMDEYEEDNFFPTDMNSVEHLELYHECNNSDGHYQFIRMEEYVNGVLVKTTPVDDTNWDEAWS
tara:strand:+ start:101 stop:448 length:348 start_codon:yes stop_codon:yes gene_type:complete